jgi:hypothetical protein
MVYYSGHSGGVEFVVVPIVVAVPTDIAEELLFRPLQVGVQ